MATKTNHDVMFYKYHTPPHLNEGVHTYTQSQQFSIDLGDACSGVEDTYAQRR